MTFYNAKVNKFGKLSAPDDTAGLYSRNKKAVLYIGHEKTGRTIAFKGFVEDFKINFNYGVKEDTDFNADTSHVHQTLSLFNYNFTMNVPATSLKEAEINLAKFQELSRYMKNNNNPGLGVSSFDDGVSKQSFLYVLFANLIQNGLYISSGVEVSSFDDIKSFGARCYMTTVDFSPDMDLGFFEKDGKFIPKAYSVSFALHLYPTFTNTRGIRRSIDGLDGKSGDYNSFDTKYWPFGITMDSNEANGTDFKETSNNYAKNKRAYIGFANRKGNSMYASFKAFIEKYSFSQETKISELANPAGTVDRIVIGGGIKHRRFSVSLTVPAESITEARANLAKFQMLCRFPVKSTSANEGNVVSDLVLSSRNVGVSLYAYFQNLISKPHEVTDAGSLDYNTIKNYGWYCIIDKLDFSVDSDAGFFEFSDGFLAPKVFKINLDLKINDIALGRFGASPTNKDKLSTGDDSKWLFGIDYTDSVDVGDGSPPTLCERKRSGLTVYEYAAEKISGWDISEDVATNLRFNPLSKMNDNGTQGASLTEEQATAIIDEYYDACKKEK